MILSGAILFFKLKSIIMVAKFSLVILFGLQLVLLVASGIQRRDSGNEESEMTRIFKRVFSNSHLRMEPEQSVRELERAVTIFPRNAYEDELLSVAQTLIQMWQPDERRCYDFALFREFSLIKQNSLVPRLPRLPSGQATSNAIELVEASKGKQVAFCQEIIVGLFEKEMEKFKGKSLAQFYNIALLYDKITDYYTLSASVSLESKLTRGIVDFMESRQQLELSNKKEFETQFNDLVVSLCEFAGGLFSEELAEKFRQMRLFIIVPDKANHWFMMDVYCKDILKNKVSYRENAFKEAKKRQMRRRLSRCITGCASISAGGDGASSSSRGGRDSNSG